MGKVSNTNCSVYGCHSHKGKEPNIHFHQFPAPNKSSVVILNSSGDMEKMDRRQAWILKLKMGKPVTNSTVVCSKHFMVEDYLSKGVCKGAPKMKLTAVPSLNLPEDNMTQSNKNLLIDEPTDPLLSANINEHKMNAETSTNPEHLSQITETNNSKNIEASSSKDGTKNYKRKRKWKEVHVTKLQEVKTEATESTLTKHEDVYDHFGQYIASLIRQIDEPLPALRVQREVVNCVLNELNGINEDYFDDDMDMLDDDYSLSSLDEDEFSSS